MAKWFGIVGYVDEVEEEPGIYVSRVTEREYFGDVTQYGKRLEDKNQINAGISVDNKLSILADPYAMNHFHNLKYVQFYGGFWEVTNVVVQYPRLHLTLGGLYHGKQT